jgi:hypothetical protein
MAKPGSNYSPSNLTEELNQQVSVDSESNTPYNYESELVTLRSLYDGRLLYTGQVTGKQYCWDKAGSMVEVSEDDALYLLEKRQGKRPCCGNLRDGTALFEKVN